MNYDGKEGINFSYLDRAFLAAKSMCNSPYLSLEKTLKLVASIVGPALVASVSSPYLGPW